MEPITSANTANYAMTLPPQQNNQVQEYPDPSSMPMVYEPEVEQKKSASSNMLGMTALGVLAAAGLGYGIVKGKKVSGLKQEIAQLSSEKDAALKLKDEAVRLKDEATQALDKERTLTRMERFKRFFNPNYGLTKEEQEARKAAMKAKAEAKKTGTATKTEAASEGKKPEASDAKAENTDKAEK